MKDTDQSNPEDNARRWMAAWRSAAHELARIRREEIRHADTGVFVAVCSGMLSALIPKIQPRPSCGLVEPQAFFAKARG